METNATVYDETKWMNMEVMTELILLETPYKHQSLFFTHNQNFRMYVGEPSSKTGLARMHG
jgi:hypothetical protein